MTDEYIFQILLVVQCSYVATTGQINPRRLASSSSSANIFIHSSPFLLPLDKICHQRSKMDKTDT